MSRRAQLKGRDAGQMHCSLTPLEPTWEVQQKPGQFPTRAPNNEWAI